MGNRGNRAFILGEQGNKGQILRGTKTILGNREHKKTNFRFLGNRGTSQFISGEQGNRYPLGGPLIWPSVYNKRLAITHQHRVNHAEAADSITVSTVFYVLSRRKIELRDSPRLSLVVSDFVQLDSISVRISERRAGFLYKYLYIVLPSHVEVIYQDDIPLPVAVNGDIDRKSRLPVFHICRHLFCCFVELRR